MSDAHRDMLQELADFVRAQDGFAAEKGPLAEFLKPERGVETVASHLALLAIDASPGDEVIDRLLNCAARLVRHARHLTQSGSAAAGGGDPLICSLCERRTSDPAVRSCTQRDCPLAERHAA